MKDKNIYIPLEGVESEHCALIVDKGLAGIPALESHHVELNNNRAVIQSDDAGAAGLAVEAIRGLGYGVPTVKAVYPVLHMTCASCAISAESMVKAVPGVVKASVNYASAELTVEYLPGSVQPADMRNAVQSIGYDLLIDDNNHQQETLETIHAKHLKRLKIKTLGGAILTAPVMIIGMLLMDMPYANEIMWALSTPVLLFAGRDFYINAWKQLKHRSANMDTLVALSTGIAYLFSVFNTVFPHFWHERGLHGHVYFEAATVIIVFILAGKLLEERAKGRTSSAIRQLMGLQPKTVNRINNKGEQEEVSIAQVEVGDTILVKPGEKIAVDGMVTDGESYVDESMLSGEPIAVLKQKDSKVFAGTINNKGSFRFKALKVGSDTMLAHIVKMVQDAQGSKAPVQKMVDKIAGIFVPVVLVLALVTMAVWMVWGGENGLSQGLMAMVTVLVIACPCALGLATPTAIMVGIGKAAQQGILIKDAESLEKIRKVNAIVLDKTGTITTGKPEVADVLWLSETVDNKRILYSIEQHSEHPLADAVVQYLKGEQAVAVTGFESHTGLGASAEYNGIVYRAGNQKMMEQYGVELPATIKTTAAQWAEQARSLIWFAGDGQLLAVLSVADAIKPTSVAAIQELRNMDIDVYLLTGDNAASAKHIAEQTGLTAYHAEMLPARKADFIKKLQARGKVVAMAGDGINDSAALALADVGIAMGQGSDIAMDVARMTLVFSDLKKIPEAIRLSGLTVNAIRQNLFWAFIYNLIGIPLAAGILYPLNGWMMNPMIAGAAMALSSISVVANSLRIKYIKA